MTINYLDKKWREKAEREPVSATQDQCQQKRTKLKQTATNIRKFQHLKQTISPFYKVKKIPTTNKGRKSPLHHQYSFQELKMHNA
jgi:hypothetical protein